MPLRIMADLVRFQMDLAWASSEWMTKIVTGPLLHRMAPRATGPRPVLTLPGFTGPEISLRPLNKFLIAQGYAAQSWGLGTNRGPKGAGDMTAIAARLGRTLDSMADRHGAKVSLIGQSLGGIYARELARARPDLVDRVITLGSPAHLDPDRPHHMNRMIGAALSWYTGLPPREHLKAAREARIAKAPPGVPLVSIYSPLDGVVAADTTIIPHSELHTDDGTPRENIEIIASHCGMGVNPVVLLALCDRLNADPGAWTPFDPQRYLPKPLDGLRRMFYPPVHHA